MSLERRIAALEAQQNPPRPEPVRFVVLQQGEELDAARVRHGFGPRVPVVIVPEKRSAEDAGCASHLPWWTTGEPHHNQS
ncbi:MAG: hypothetical protein R3F10_03525 [Lysobacteraceae bacterium]